MRLPDFSLRASVRFALVLNVLALACSVGPPRQTGEAPSANLIEERVTFLAVGDIMISRGVARAIQKANDPLLPFGRMKNHFASTDFNFANLESPIADKERFPARNLVFNTRERHAVGLKVHNFQVLNLANNHALDQGPEGLRSTQNFLTQQGHTYVGAGDDLYAAWQPKTVEIRGVKIGFVGASYSSINDNGATRNPYVARIEDIDRLARSINEMRAKGTDFVVATMHAGTEYTRRPNKSQIDFARTAIDLGADIVIGAHPHWVQTIEEYKGKFIFYSLGNFIFDQEWSRDTKEGLAIAVMLNCRKVVGASGCLSEKFIEQIELLPVIVENRSTPRPADLTETEAILKKIGRTSNLIVPREEPINARK